MFKLVLEEVERECPGIGVRLIFLLATCLFLAICFSFLFENIENNNQIRKDTDIHKTSD